MYPKEPKAVEDPAEKKRNRKNNMEHINQLPGLKGYSAAGKQVFGIMSEKFTRKMQNQMNALTFDQEASDDVEVTPE